MAEPLLETAAARDVLGAIDDVGDERADPQRQHREAARPAPPQRREQALVRREPERHRLAGSQSGRAPRPRNRARAAGGRRSWKEPSSTSQLRVPPAIAPSTMPAAIPIASAIGDSDTSASTAPMHAPANIPATAPRQVHADA